tara:strand:- start:4139 stop:5401 length:1263 start_codon:yes stop_codon:yes gene_type:complete
MERERHINDLKKIASLSKNKNNIKTQKQRNVLGKNVITAIEGMGCKPHKVFYKPSINFSINGSLSNKKGIRKIGKGQMGEVFLGCVDKECKKPVAIKVSNDPTRYEYKIGKRIEKLSGTRMYAYQECDKYSIIYTEYANSGSLTNFIKENVKTLRPIHLRTIVTHVLFNLYRIHKKYPSFRHHDLHTENVLVSTNVKAKGIRRFKIDDIILKVHDIGIEASLNDFGFSSINGIPNPDVDSGDFKRKHGIYRESNYMYDVHFFLNSMRHFLKGEKIYAGAETIQFIERVLPPDYLGHVTYKVFDFRLRTSPEGHGSLPSFKRIFNDRYFSPYKEKKQELSKVLDIIGKTPIKPKSITVKHGGNPAPPKVSLSKKGYVRIGTRKCESYKKSELIKIANILNIPTKGKTISQICQGLKLKYVK